MYLKMKKPRPEGDNVGSIEEEYMYNWIRSVQGV